MSNLILEFKFLTKRYHATQWGRNVNEGVIDWPPSPWRILRAIISAWKLYTKIDEEKIKPILEKMCKSKVVFHIPNAVQSHTRHYMPINNPDKKNPLKSETEKIIDSFIMMEGEHSVYAKWNMSLEKDEEDILKDITSKIRYLGRAESWCQVNLYNDTISPNCIPMEDSKSIENKEIIEVMTPTNDATLENLCVETSDTYKQRMSHPIGSKCIHYTRPNDCLTKIEVQSRSYSDIEVVRYMIVGSFQPDITETIHVGDFIKRVAMSKYGQQNNSKVSETLSGKDKNNNILKGHNHAFYLPTDENLDGKLDHITIITKNKFTKEEMSALYKIRDIKYHDRFQLIYEAGGKIKDFYKVPIIQSAKKWQSVTPYVLNRHMKIQKGIIKDGPGDQLKREIEKRFGNNLISNIIIKNSKSNMNSRMPIQFKRWRKNKLAGFGAYNVTIEFKDEMQGPLSFGHGSHYGLGLFTPLK